MAYFKYCIISYVKINVKKLDVLLKQSHGMNKITAIPQNMWPDSTTFLLKMITIYYFCEAF